MKIKLFEEFIDHFDDKNLSRPYSIECFIDNLKKINTHIGKLKQKDYKKSIEIINLIDTLFSEIPGMKELKESINSFDQDSQKDT